MLRFLLISVALTILVGCTPRVVVRKSIGINDTGIKYYRPKPYLLIAPIGKSEAKSDGKTTTTTTTKSDEFVEIELQYLPDFAEEYSIDVKPGLGTANVSLKLEDGWNLTELNQNLDSNVDDNIKALTELAKSTATIIPTSNPVEVNKGGRTEVTTKMVVNATNVPLGYYEAVIGGSACKKRMMGWRYVGFAPFNSCPTDVCGSATTRCNEPSGTIYGLGFEQGAMVFKQLNAMHSNPAPSSRIGVETERKMIQEVKAASNSPSGTISKNSIKEKLVKFIKDKQWPGDFNLQVVQLDEDPITKKYDVVIKSDIEFSDSQKESLKGHLGEKFVISFASPQPVAPSLTTHRRSY